jgi:4-hydroxybenzoate polyprenyltransferase
MESLGLRRLIKISRPRFWIYLLGPFMLGWAIHIPAQDFWLVLSLTWPALSVFGYHFTFASNLLLYGVNDMFDYETDRLNPKKQNYEGLVLPEERPRLVYLILVAHAPIISYLWFWWKSAELLPSLFNSFVTFAILSLLFILLAIGYSAPPIRAKARPFWDSLFNVLYVVPGLIGYLLAADIATLQWPLVLAACLWCIAMHAYSAVPDIESDTQAGLSTIATALGKTRTLWFCLVCYAAAALLSVSALKWLAYLLGATYLVLMGLSLKTKNNPDLFRYYKLFPFINTLAGAALFFFILLAK